jgi:hypothetical protein
MKEEITWEVSGGGQSTSPAKKKMPFISPYNVTGELDEPTKKCLVNFNLMQKELIKNGLMESK